MPEPKARKLAIAVLAVLVVIIVIPAVALFVRGGGDQPVQIILPTPGGTGLRRHWGWKEYSRRTGKEPSS